MEFNHQLLAKEKRYSSKHTALLVQGKCSGLQLALKFRPEGCAEQMSMSAGSQSRVCGMWPWGRSPLLAVVSGA